MDLHSEFKKIVDLKGLSKDPVTADESESDTCDDFEIEAVIDSAHAVLDTAVEVLDEHNYLNLWNIQYSVFYGLMNLYWNMVQDLDFGRDEIKEFIDEFKKDLDREFDEMVFD